MTKGRHIIIHWLQYFNIFLWFHLPLFFSLSAIALELINLKVYVINCLNKNLIIHLVWYLEKENRYDNETLSTDRVLNKEHFYGKIMQKMCTKSLPQTPFFILVNNLKQPLHARTSFKNKIFWKGIIKSLLKSLLYFFFWIQSLLIDKGLGTSDQSLF